VGLSCGDLVLVYESAEDWFSADPVLGEVDRLRWPGVSLGRCELAESTVPAAGVVVPQVLGQHLAQVVSVTISERSTSSRRRAPMILSRIASLVRRRSTVRFRKGALIEAKIRTVRTAGWDYRWD
jgi:hypothetical protein